MGLRPRFLGALAAAAAGPGALGAGAALADRFRRLFAGEGSSDEVGITDLLDVLEFEVAKAGENERVRDKEPEQGNKFFPSDVHFLAQTVAFVSALIQRSALIPQIVRNKSEQRFVRWLPALFDDAVRTAFEGLVSRCPRNLVSLEASGPEAGKVASKGSGASGGAQAEWACGVCTFLNKPASKKCVMCQQGVRRAAPVANGGARKF